MTSVCVCAHTTERLEEHCVSSLREVKQRKQGAVGAAVPQLRLCSQHSLHVVLSEPDEEITASLEGPHHGFHFYMSSVL